MGVKYEKSWILRQILYLNQYAVRRLSATHQLPKETKKSPKETQKSVKDTQEVT